MATPATIASGAYQQKIGKDKAIGIPCPKLVPYIENGVDKAVIIDELKYLLDPWMNQCDGIVLGCTHYPILSKDIQALYPQATIYSSSVAVADEVACYLEMHHLQAQDLSGVHKVYTTGDLESFKKSSRSFFNPEGFEIAFLNLKVA